MLDACGFWTLAGWTVAGADSSPMIGMNSMAHQGSVWLGSSLWYCCCEGAVSVLLSSGDECLPLFAVAYTPVILTQSHTLAEYAGLL
jgi:hypothetical protein